MEESVNAPSRWKKPLIGAGIVTVIIFCGLAAGLSRTDLNEAAGAYDKNKSDAEQAGLYFDRSQVDALYAVPAADNGAQLIQSVLPVIQKLKLDNSKPIAPGFLAAHSAEIEPAVATIEEASHRKYLMFKRDFSNPAATPFPEFSGVKRWVAVLVQLGHDAAEKKEYAKTQRYLTLAAYLSNKMDSEGLLIGVLVRIACLAVVEKELKGMISAHGNDPATIQVIDEVLVALDQPYDLKKPIRIEHWFGTSMVDAFLNDPKTYASLSGSTGIPNEIRYGKYLPRFKRANLSRIYRFYADAANGMPADSADLVGIQQGFSSMDLAAMKPGLSYSMLGVMAPVFSQTGVAIAKEIAQRNALRQAVALIKSGAAPGAGLPLKGRFAMDVDGKPIRMKKLESGWIVYSVGMDRVDDGGVEAPMGKGDYVVHLPK